jgi:serine/threonine-protein kinase
MSIERLSKYIKYNKNKIVLSLGEFQLSKQIGLGGNGLVYKASINGKEVAIKFLTTNATGQTKQTKLERFIAEYFNVITLENNTNIVRYIDYDVLKFTDDESSLDFPVIIMKLYDCSLEKKQESKNSEEFNRLFNFLLVTVENIHDNGIIHRDIKPENILVEGEGFVLADFGIANYNPEMFEIRARTGAKERLGNRLFSAPEQEDSGVTPHPTMDIYAIGQVLQWYATGKTHRGTGRQSILSFFPDDKVIDDIIETSLNNNPKDRFQSINDIREFIKGRSRKDPFEYLYSYNEVCRSSFPKEDGVFYCNDIIKINRLLNNFAKKKEDFGRQLWWFDGTIDFYFTPIQTDTDIWLFNSHEHKINEIWIHFDGSNFNDFVLVHYLPNEPFSVDGEIRYTSAIVDDEHHITYNEFQNGFAEINGEVIELADHKVVLIEKEKEEGYFFISTKYHCLYQGQNFKQIRVFIDNITKNGPPTIEKLVDFERKIRANKHPYVQENL